MARRPRVRSRLDLRGLPGGEHVHCVLEQEGGGAGTLRLAFRPVRGNAEPPFTVPWGDWTEPAAFDSAAGARRWVAVGLPEGPRRGERHVVELLVTAEAGRVHRRRFTLEERAGAWRLGRRWAWRRARVP